MKISNGKVWYENISEEINDISQLDRNIYKGLFELIEHGANFEIGPGIPPEHGNGLYCTNWTIEQITDYFSNNSYEKEATIDIAEEKSLPNELFDTIINMAKSYQLADIHAKIGINTGDVLYGIESKYETEIIPKMKSLSEEDRKKLLTLIENEIEKNDPNAPKYFLEGAKKKLIGSKRRSI